MFLSWVSFLIAMTAGGTACFKHWKLEFAFSQQTDLNFGISVHTKFPVPAAPSFYEAGPPALIAVESPLQWRQEHIVLRSRINDEIDGR